MAVFVNHRGMKHTGADRSSKVLSFLDEVDALQKRFDLSIMHQDQHGAFEIIHGYGESWVDDASEIVVPITKG